MRLITIILILPFFALAQSRPNIVFMLADDLGHGEIGSTVSDWHSPNIDSLRAQGAYFNRFYVQPACSPTRTAFLTGRYPWKQGMGENVIRQYEDRGIPYQNRTIADRFKDEGYVTGFIGKWHVGHAYAEQMPYNRGFDYSFGWPTGSNNYNAPFTRKNDAHDFQLNGQFYTTGEYATEDFGDKAAAWIAEQAADSLQPFFLYLAWPAPHSPLQAPTDTVNLAPAGFSADKKIKWAMNRIQDNEVGKVWQAIQDAGIEENTIIIFTSDNGGELEDAAGSNPGTGVNEDIPGDNTPFEGEKTQLYEGGIRVPFIWYHKGTIARETEIDSVCGIIDMWPTLVNRIGGTNIESDSLDGQDFGSLLGYSGSDSWTANRYYIGYLSDAPQWCVFRGPWKLVNNPQYNTVLQGSYSDDIRLYNVVTDTMETTDVKASNVSIRNELEAIITTNEGRLVSDPTVSGTKPGGWWDFPFWALPRTWWDPSYYFFR